ncbi:MAG: helix-turn-helix transcriptional regulator [Micropruina sp.]|nr:helix-turn-helix transcriptional regulator [Micropruina sp.]
MPRPEPLELYVLAARLLGEKVRALREERGLTQEELAHRTGIARNQIQNIEHSRNNAKDPLTGRHGPGNARLDTVFRLAHELGVEVTYLIDPERSVYPLPKPGVSGSHRRR